MIYTPAAGYSGPDWFSFVVTESDGVNGAGITSDAGDVTITVAVPPQVADRNVGVAEHTSTVIVLTSDGAAGLTETTVAGPAHGTLSNFNAEAGAITYTPASGYLGSDSFTYTLTGVDASGSSAGLTSMEATVSINVSLKPSGDTQSVTSVEETASTIQLTGDDGDPNTVQTLSFVIIAQPNHGTLSDFDSATGQVAYTPADHYYGQDSFSFATCYTPTGGGAVYSDPATVEITVTPVAKDPVAGDQEVLVGAGSSATILLGTPGDPEAGEYLTLSVTSGPNHGTLTDYNPATGTVVYNPYSGYTSDSFSFTLTDASSGVSAGRVSPVATVYLAIKPAPTASNAKSDDRRRHSPLADPHRPTRGQ